MAGEIILREIILTMNQILNLCEFAGIDINTKNSCFSSPGEEYLLETEFSIAQSRHGAFAYLTEYPEEGIYPLSGKPRCIKPKVVCLCGSSRFYEAYQQAEYNETMKGNIYLSIGFYPHSVRKAHGEGVGCTSEEKIALDALHKKKIDLADEVFVLNVGGYIGDSTKSEVEYAKASGKPIRWLEPIE